MALMDYSKNYPGGAEVPTGLELSALYSPEDITPISPAPPISYLLESPAHFAEHRRLREASEHLGQLASEETLATARRDVSSWFLETGQADLTLEARMDNITNYLATMHGAVTKLLDIRASRVFIDAMRALENDKAHGHLPDRLPPPGIDGGVTSAIPILRFLDPALHHHAMRGAPGVRALISQERESQPDSSDAAGETGVRGWVRGMAKSVRKALAFNMQDANIGSKARSERRSRDRNTTILYPTESSSAETVPLSKQFLVNRLEFVRAMGWLPNEESDEDRYDLSPDTVYILRSDPSDHARFLAGMRLTKVSNPEESMSWGMIEGSDELKREVKGSREYAKLLKAAERGELWDLTRLVPDMELALMGRDAVRDTFLDLFGGGVNLTVNKEGGSNPAWFFLTTPRLWKYLSSIGVSTRIVGSAKISPDDSDKSLFCIVYPLEVLNKARAGTSTERHMRDRVLATAQSF